MTCNPCTKKERENDMYKPFLCRVVLWSIWMRRQTGHGLHAVFFFWKCKQFHKLNIFNFLHRIMYCLCENDSCETCAKSYRKPYTNYLKAQPFWSLQTLNTLCCYKTLPMFFCCCCVNNSTKNTHLFPTIGILQISSTVNASSVLQLEWTVSTFTLSLGKLFWHD